MVQIVVDAFKYKLYKNYLLLAKSRCKRNKLFDQNLIYWKRVDQILWTQEQVNYRALNNNSPIAGVGVF